MFTSSHLQVLGAATGLFLRFQSSAQPSTNQRAESSAEPPPGGFSVDSHPFHVAGATVLSLYMQQMPQHSYHSYPFLLQPIVQLRDSFNGGLTVTSDSSTTCTADLDLNQSGGGGGFLHALHNWTTLNATATVTQVLLCCWNMCCCNMCCCYALLPCCSVLFC